MKPNFFWRAGLLRAALAAILAGTFAITAAAQTEAIEQQLLQTEAQINSGDNAAALVTLLSLRTSDDRLELRRLWAVAIAYIRDNRPRAALPFLEELVSRAPDNVTYRLELAATLQRIGQIDRAKYHYELTRGAELDAAVAQEVDRRIDTIHREKSWEARVEIAVAPESNPARKTAAETVNIGGLEFQLSEESRAQPAQGIDLGLGYTALPRMNDNLRLRLGLNFDGRLYDGQAPDDIQVQAEFGLLLFGDRDRRLSASGTIARRWYDGRSYSETIGGYITASQTFGKGQRTRITGVARHERTKFDELNNYLSKTTSLSVQVERIMTPRWQVRLGLSAEQTVTPLMFESGVTQAWSLGSQYAFDGGLLIDVSIKEARTKKDGLDPLFGQLRRDQRSTVGLKILHRRLNFQKLAPFAEIEFDRQKSNSAIFSYDNTRVGLGLTARF